MDKKFQVLGDQAVIIHLGQDLTEETHQLVIQWTELLDRLQEQQQLGGIVNIVPTYTNVTVYYSSHVWTYDHLVDFLRKKEKQLKEVNVSDRRLVEIGVCYDQEFGTDLADVAHYNGLTVEDVIRIHADQTYTVYMLGFSPGFPYLGGMSPRITMPRLDEPRMSIPAGSVGIAGPQTGIYPQEGPGGWRLIGRTPVCLFDMNNVPPALLKVGDHVCFVPLSRREYELQLEVKVNDHDQ